MPVAESAPVTLITKEELSKRPEEIALASDPRHRFEVDDAARAVRGKFNRNISRVKIHKADAGLLMGHSAVDDAIERGGTEYSPRGTAELMLPEDIAIHGLSLGIDHYGLGSPALTTAFTFHHDTRQVTDVEFYYSRLKCETVSYETFAAMLAGGAKKAKALYDVARLIGESPGKVANLGEGVQAAMAVNARLMRTDNELWGAHLVKQGTPFLWRNHQLSILEIAGRDEVIRRLYPHTGMFDQGMSWYSPVPIGHDATGADAFAHMTSPLRRAPDLINHINYRAHTNGQPVPYPEDALNNIAYQLAMQTHAIKRGLGRAARRGATQPA